MKRATLAMAFALLVLPVTAPPALADMAEPFGSVCGFSSATDPQVEGSQTSEVVGGPLVITDDAGIPLTGEMFCTIQVNASTHAGPDACSLQGPTTPAVVAVTGTCTYAASPDDNVYLCTEIWVYYHGHKTLWWADSNDPLVEGRWSEDPNSSCALATTVNGPDGAEVDPIVCPILALAFPPEGDIGLREPIGLLWDCPPYES